MLVLSCVLLVVAAAIHGYIFVLESLLWTTPRARAVFGTTEAEAATTRSMALNQGFYNLFLAVVLLLGVVLLLTGDRGAGPALVLAGAGSMVGAGLVLVISSPAQRRPAAVQALPPALGLVAMGVALLG